MGDRGYTIGILIGCALLLGAGVLFTWLEIQEYRQDDVPRPDPVTITEPEPVEEPEPDAEDGDEPGENEN